MMAGFSMFVLGLAAATAQPTQRDATITVTGEQPQDIRREVADYVKQVGIVVGEQPAARWIDPVCPQAIGIPAELATKVIAQVRSVAAKVGAPVASGKCEANVVLAFSDDGQGLVKVIASRGSIGELTHQQRLALENDTAPIRWWYASEVRNADGTPMDGGAASPALQMSGGGMYGNFQQGGIAGRQGNSNARGASLISVPTVRSIRHATVVIDVNRATGKKLASVVDYAALVALAEVRQGAAPSDSVLNLFQATDSRRLSPNDTAMLKGLYRIPLARKADQQRRSLVTSILAERLGTQDRSSN
jgi:hypothetical protein